MRLIRETHAADVVSYNAVARVIHSQQRVWLLYVFVSELRLHESILQKTTLFTC